MQNCTNIQQIRCHKGTGTEMQKCLVGKVLPFFIIEFNLKKNKLYNITLIFIDFYLNLY